ncbi:MAG: hypothetical protein RL172_2981 [Bacteroidota bacterium]
MIAAIKKELIANYVNLRGWRTKRKILVIESDDWGAIRTASKAAWDSLVAKNIPLNSNYFSRFDCLESTQDLNELFNLLSSFKDKQGNPLCITANALVANPNFEAIQQSNFQQYHYELITATYSRYPDGIGTFNTWQKGMAEHLLYPQFHGREHINPAEWMRVLQTGDANERLAFEHQTILGLDNPAVSDRYLNYTSAFNYNTSAEASGFETIIKEGLAHFKELFGFTSKSFVAPCGIRSDDIDDWLKQNGVLYHQVARQFVPDGNGGVYPKNRWWGDVNKQGQLYWRRNGTFEPSRDWNFDWVNSVLKDAEYAFRWGKPLVLNSHRVNYVGGLDIKNRENTLRLLSAIVKKLQQRYPDIEFMSSDQLGDYMCEAIKK